MAIRRSHLVLLLPGASLILLLTTLVLIAFAMGGHKGYVTLPDSRETRGLGGGFEMETQAHRERVVWWVNHSGFHFRPHVDSSVFHQQLRFVPSTGEPAVICEGDLTRCLAAPQDAVSPDGKAVVFTVRHIEEEPGVRDQYSVLVDLCYWRQGRAQYVVVRRAELGKFPLYSGEPPVYAFRGWLDRGSAFEYEEWQFKEQDVQWHYYNKAGSDWYQEAMRKEIDWRQHMVPKVHRWSAAE